MKPFDLALGTALLCGSAQAQWSVTSLSYGRDRLAAAPAGTAALFAGGYGSAGGVTDVVDLYDTATATWSTASLSRPMYDLVAAGVGDIALFTGPSDCCTPQPVVDVYDASTGTWSSTLSPNPNPPLGPAVTTHGSDIYFGGGFNLHNAGYTDRVEIYDTQAGTWRLETLSLDRGGLAATTVGDLVMFAGGVYSTGSVTIVDILDTQTNTWSTAPLSLARWGLAAASAGGKALFAGGSVGIHAQLFDRVDIYDAATGVWTQAALSQARTEMGVTSIGPYVLFAGGRAWSVTQWIRSDRVDIYDSRTDTWSTATLSQGRFGPAATSVGGLALFGGGWHGFAGSVYSTVVDVFDPELGTLYCVPAVPNSTGVAGVLGASGSLSVAANELTVIATQLPPGQFGYFLTSLSQGFIPPPASQGPICLSGNIGRFNRAGEIIQGPVGVLQLDLASMPVNPSAPVLPGETWNFQCWYRDVNPGSTSNTTGALAVTFETPGDPAVQFPVTQRSLLEDTVLIEVRVTLSQRVDHDVQVSYTTGGTATVNVDWRVEEPNPFVIPAGRRWADMTLLVAEDAAPEPNETATVTLTSASGAIVGTAPTFTLSIVNDD